MSLTLLVLPSPELGKQLLQRKQWTSNCMTHPLKRERKSLCVNSCIINKNSSFSKVLTFWVKPLPGVIPLSSVNLHEKKSGPLCLEAEVILAMHLFHSLENYLQPVCIICICMYNMYNIHVHMHMCVCIKKLNFSYVTNFNVLIYQFKCILIICQAHCT